MLMKAVWTVRGVVDHIAAFPHSGLWTLALALGLAQAYLPASSWVHREHVEVVALMVHILQLIQKPGHLPLIIDFTLL